MLAGASPRPAGVEEVGRSDSGSRSTVDRYAEPVGNLHTIRHRTDISTRASQRNKTGPGAHETLKFAFRRSVSKGWVGRSRCRVQSPQIRPELGTHQVETFPNHLVSSSSEADFSGVTSHNAIYAQVPNRRQSARSVSLHDRASQWIACRTLRIQEYLGTIRTRPCIHLRRCSQTA